MNKENLRPASSRPLRSSSPQLAAPARQLDHTHDQYLRLIVAHNADYFRTKLRDPPACNRKDLRLKLPSRTGQTTYRKDYRQKRQPHSHSQDHLGQEHSHRPDSTQLRRDPADLTISAATSYQDDFKRHTIARTQSCRRLKRRMPTGEDEEDVPRFLETQNKTDFLNWAGKNYVPLMKPSERPAATNLPFEATSVYRAEFDQKSVPATQPIPRQSSFPRFAIVPTCMKTNYASEFCAKKGSGVEVSCKPKPKAATLCKQFKGSTEYKRQFGGTRDQWAGEQRVRTVQELQALIVDL